MAAEEELAMVVASARALRTAKQNLDERPTSFTRQQEVQGRLLALAAAFLLTQPDFWEAVSKVADGDTASLDELMR